MKILVGLFSIALSFSALASTVDTKTFVYDGSQDSIELILNTEKTHTEYTIQDVQTTCYRQEIVGYRSVCTGGYYPHPGPRPGRYPYPGGIRSCYQQPIYRSVAYPCVQTVRTPYEVKDYDVNARVIVDVTNFSGVATPGEKIKVTLNGENLFFNVVGSKKFFIVKKEQNVRGILSGSVKSIDALLAVELVEAAPVLKAIKLSNISMSKGVLTLGMGEVKNTDNIGFSLKVSKVKTLGSDTVLFDRELTSEEVVVNGSKAEINVDNLTEVSDGKFNLTAKAFAKFDGTLMNDADFDELTSSRTLIYKIR